MLKNGRWRNEGDTFDGGENEGREEKTPFGRVRKKSEGAGKA